MSANTRKLIDRLLIEHMHHAGTQNGFLASTHEQLVEYGLTRSQVTAAIREAEALGLIRTLQGGRWGGTNKASKYRLTWMGWRDTEGVVRDPTNEWKAITDEGVAAIRAAKSERLAGKKRRKAFRLIETPS